jgi:hypothetical protein
MAQRMLVKRRANHGAFASTMWCVRLEPGHVQRLARMLVVAHLAEAHEGLHLVDVAPHRLRHLLGLQHVGVERVVAQRRARAPAATAADRAARSGPGPAVQHHHLAQPQERRRHQRGGRLGMLRNGRVSLPRCAGEQVGLGSWLGVPLHLVGRHLVRQQRARLVAGSPPGRCRWTTRANMGGVPKIKTDGLHRGRRGAMRAAAAARAAGGRPARRRAAPCAWARAGASGRRRAAAHAPRQQQAVDRLHAQARHAQQQLARRAVDVDREALGCASAQASLGSTSSDSMPPADGGVISSAAKP